MSSAKLAQLVRAAKVNAAYLAWKVDVTQATIHNWLDGGTAPSVGAALSLADALGCNIRDFCVRRKRAAR